MPGPSGGITKKKGVRKKGKRFVPILEAARRLREEKKNRKEKPRTQHRHLVNISKEYNDHVIVAAFDFIVNGGNEEHIPGLLGISEKKWNRWKKENQALRLMLYRASKSLKAPNTDRYRHLKPLQRKFLMAYEKIGTIQGACKAVGMNASNHYCWIGDDPAYHSDNYIAAWEVARNISNNRVEAEIYRRAIKGVRRYKFHNGEPIWIATTEDDPEGVRIQQKDGSAIFMKHYYELNYSDTLLIFEAKRRMPEYRDKSQVEVEHKGSVLMEMVEASESQGPKSVEVIDVEFVNKEAQRLIEEHTQSQIYDSGMETGEEAEEWRDSVQPGDAGDS